MPHERIRTTEKEMAALLSCSKRHLVNLRNQRRIPFVKLGRLIRYNPIAVTKTIEKLSFKEIG